jgi:hypothetical protein
MEVPKNINPGDGAIKNINKKRLWNMNLRDPSQGRKNARLCDTMKICTDGHREAHAVR